MPRHSLLLAALLCGATGCFGVPHSIAPNLKGSVGVPHRGVLTDGLALPKKGPGYRRFRKDDINWGNPRLVRSIQRAAATVAKEIPGGAPLVVADLSAKRGGRITRHRSHRTGRDGDLLFYVTTPDGRSVSSAGFNRFGTDGLAFTKTKSFLRFDVERNWLLVKALVTDPEAAIQYLFVARWLEAQLVEHAIARGEDLVTIWHAQVVLRQPGDSAAHDDHFHIRIACTPDESAQGCEGGPQRPWLPQPTAVEITDDQLLSALFDGPSEP